MENTEFAENSLEEIIIPILISVRFSMLLISIPLYLPLVLFLLLSESGITLTKRFAALIITKFQI